MESQFRQLGLQFKLDNGKFMVLNDYIVCEKGKELTVNQSKMVVRNCFYYRNISGLKWMNSK